MGQERGTKIDQLLPVYLGEPTIKRVAFGPTPDIIRTLNSNISIDQA
jgi:hypothetical protein